MRCYTQPHPFSCGLDLHARTMSLCVLHQDGAMLGHRNLPAGPAPFLTTVAPSRSALGVCVACICTWYGLADLCARAGMPFVLGHALSMQAMHGGKATNATIEAHKLALLVRGGMLPQASVSPAERRATRDRLRRRRPLLRQRAALLPPVQQTHRPYHVPESGTKIASTTQRAGGAARCADPAVHKSLEVALALRDSDDEWLRDVAWAMGTTAQQHDAHTLDVLQTVPGMGTRLRLGRLDERPDLARCPRGQACVSSCRVVTCAQAAAGKRSGTSGPKRGHA